MSMTARIRRLIADASGSNLIEAALLTPLLVFMTLSIIEFAMLFYASVTLQHGVSEATRYAVTGNQASGLSRAEALRQALRAATPTLTIPDEAVAFSHLPPGGGAWVEGPGGPDDIEKMTVNYTWELLTPALRPFFTDGEVRLRVESARKNERRFP